MKSHKFDDIIFADDGSRFGPQVALSVSGANGRYDMELATTKSGEVLVVVTDADGQDVFFEMVPSYEEGIIEAMNHFACHPKVLLDIA